MVIITIFFLFLETNIKTLIDNNNNNELISSYILGHFTWSFGIRHDGL